MIAPPAYKPKSKRPDIVEAFFADPLNSQMRTANQEWTPLGVAIQMYGELRRLLKREAPDALKFVDDNDL